MDETMTVPNTTSTNPEYENICCPDTFLLLLDFKTTIEGYMKNIKKWLIVKNKMLTYIYVLVGYLLIASVIPLFGDVSGP